MRVKVKLLTETAKMPTYAHPGDVGADIYSDEDFYLVPGNRTVVSTGIAIELPESYRVCTHRS
jgi:dUTP pyrophosphatase